jgi:hypothetical protein
MSDNMTEEAILICPHCNHYVLIEKLNCGIFRHGILKSNNTQINPHASKEECEHFIIRRKSIDYLSNKELFDTRFHHVGCDNWLWHQMKGMCARAENTKTNHKHFSRLANVMDDVYTEGWSKVEEDRTLLEQLINGNNS